MNGSIVSRKKKSGIDKQGIKRKNMTVYDVQYRVTDPKTGKRVKRHKRGFLTKHDAEAFILEINRKDAQGILQQETNLTVRDYFDRWLTANAQNNSLRRSTIEHYRLIAEKYILPHIGSIKLSKLQAQDLERLYAELEKQKSVRKAGSLSKTTIAYIHLIIKMAMKYAIQHDFIGCDPTIKILRPPTKTKYVANIYEAKQAQALLKIAHEKTPLLELPIALALVCGLRRGECLGIRVEDIDFQKNQLHVRRQIKVLNDGTIIAERPKTINSRRNISLPDEIIKLIRNRIELNESNKALLGNGYHDDGWLNCNEDGTWINPKGFTARFKRLLKSNNLENLRFHDLRHTFASMMLKEGENLKVISAILGHSSISITADLYIHVTDEQKQAASNKMSNIIFSGSSNDSNLAK